MVLFLTIGGMDAPFGGRALLPALLRHRDLTRQAPAWDFEIFGKQTKAAPTRAGTESRTRLQHCTHQGILTSLFDVNANAYSEHG